MEKSIIFTIRVPDWDDRGVGDEGEMDPGVGHQVRLELVQIHIQGPFKPVRIQVHIQGPFKPGQIQVHIQGSFKPVQIQVITNSIICKLLWVSEKKR